MNIQLIITASDPVELEDCVRRLGKNLAGSIGKAPEPETMEPEVVEPERKPRSRARKAETIEHEGKPDVRTATDDSVERNREPAGAEAGTGAAVATSEKATANNEASEVDAVAEASAESALTIDDLRKYTLSNYLLKFHKSLDDQKNAFDALLKEFGVKKMVDLPEGKIGEFKALVDAKIAEVKASLGSGNSE